MIPYEDALNIVKREFNKIKTRVIEIPLEDASGYILAEDIYTDTYLPPFNNSSMDGFAVKYSEGTSCWKIIGEIAAGKYEDYNLEGDSAVRIMTGGKLPSNANAVIPLEDVDEENGIIELKAGSHFKSGQNIRRKGEDTVPGILVFRSSTLLKPQNISIAAACGKDTLKVFEKIKVGVMATGDELIDISNKPDGDKIRATNLYTLISLIKEAGMASVNLGIVPDNKDALTKKISEALNSEIDILITTGGVSVGKYDYLKDIYNDLGVEIYFSKVNVKPGKPVVFGRLNSKLIFGLPGNPVSSFVSFIVFIKESLRDLVKTMGHYVNAELLGSIKKQDTKRHFVRGTINYNNASKTYFVKECGAQSSGNMAGLNNSNCLIIFPEEKNILAAGEIVSCILI